MSNVYVEPVAAPVNSSASADRVAVQVAVAAVDVAHAVSQADRRRLIQ
jgi:hypothetical protein